MHTGRGLTGVRTLRLYVVAVTAMATTLAIAVSLTVHVPHSPRPATLALMCGLLWLTEFLQVRQYHYRGHGISHNLIEGVLALAIYACSGSQVVLICLIGLVAAEALRRTGVMKTVFNVAQWLLAAMCGLLVFHALAPSDASAARAIAGVALASATMS